MTTPVDLSAIVPSKAKTWVGLIGSLLTFVGPFVLQSADLLPSPWPAVIGVVFALATTLGVYHAPYKPAGTTLAPVDTKVSVTVDRQVDSTTPNVSAPEVQPPADDGTYPNPWK